MPQIGWFEILIIVVLAIIIIGPKDIPVVLKKMGSWVPSIKRYISEIQKDITNIEEDIQKEISFKDDYINKFKDKKKDD